MCLLARPYRKLVDCLANESALVLKRLLIIPINLFLQNMLFFKLSVYKYIKCLYL